MIVTGEIEDACDTRKVVAIRAGSANDDPTEFRNEARVENLALDRVLEFFGKLRAFTRCKVRRDLWNDIEVRDHLRGFGWSECG